MTNKQTGPSGLVERLERVLDHAEAYEAPADGIAYGEHILRFADIRALIAALTASRPPDDGWMPIETAPKDKVLLLFGQLYGAAYEIDAHPKGPIRACGYWDSLDEAWALTDKTWAGPLIEPTHWRLLPNAPAALSSLEKKD